MLFCDHQENQLCEFISQDNNNQSDSDISHSYQSSQSDEAVELKSCEQSSDDDDEDARNREKKRIKNNISY